MSRDNRVNPGTYTQRGRLTQDDAARELRKQTVLGSPHTWQPVNKTKPWPAPAGEPAHGAERPADNETVAETSPQKKTRPAARLKRKRPAIKAGPAKGKPKAAKATTARTSTSTGTTAKTTTKKRRTTKPTRRAVRAGNRSGSPRR